MFLLRPPFLEADTAATAAAMVLEQLPVEGDAGRLFIPPVGSETHEMLEGDADALLFFRLLPPPLEDILRPDC